MVAHDDPRGKPQSSIELELSAVVSVDSSEVDAISPIQLLQRRNGFLRAIQELQRIAGAAGFTDPAQIAIVGNDRLSHRTHRIIDLRGGRLQRGVCLHDLLGYLVLNVGETNRGRVLFGNSFMNQRGFRRRGY